MPAIVANTRLSITLPAGNTLIISGSGTLQVAPPYDASVDGSARTLGSAATTLGPYRIAETINIETGATGAVYTTSDGAAVPPLTNSEANATRALVSKYGNAGEPDFAIARAWAALPLPADYIGRAYVTDLRCFADSDGTRWRIVGGEVFLDCGTDTITNTVNSTAEQDVLSVPIPAGLLVAGSYLEVFQFWQSPAGSAGAKTPRIRLGSTEFFAPTTSLTGTANFIPPITTRIFATGATSQFGYSAANGGLTTPTGSINASGSENLNTLLNLRFTIQKAVGTDTVSLLARSVKLVRT